MGLLIFGVIIAVAGIIAAVSMKHSRAAVAGKVIGVVGFILGAVIIVTSCFATVPTGHTGILTTFGKVEDTTYEAGVHFILPWQKVVNMDNRVQKLTKDMEAFSSDIQEVTLKYTLNYRIESSQAQKLYKTVGVNYATTIIEPKIEDAVKTITAQYNAENLVSKRAELGDKIEILLTESLSSYNIVVTGTAVENLDFTDEFTNAVEAKQVAEQNKIKAKTEQERQTMEKEEEFKRNEAAAQSAAKVAKTEAESAAEVAKIQANADLEVSKIQADAAEYAGQKEAAKNKALSSSLTEELLKYNYILQWNGQLPETYMGTENVNTLLDITK
ncbi:MAG: prohibitin family protein [Lachnospiraceae bacterium]|nr:prohibitin family protein [Lachnospiraceae bacterium]